MPTQTKTERLETEERAARLVKARQHAGHRGAVSAAKAFGWNVNTYKAHESGRNGFGIADAKKYAEAYGVGASWLQFGSDGDKLGRPPTPDFSRGDPTENDLVAHDGRRLDRINAELSMATNLPIVGEVQAGAWLERDELDAPKVDQFDVPADPRFPTLHQCVWIVRGRSVEKVARDGEALVCVMLGNGSPIEPRDGDLVIAERSRSQGALVEITAKLLRIYQGHSELVPQYSDEKLNKPLRLDDGADEETEVRIVAVAIGKYQPFRTP